MEVKWNKEISEEEEGKLIPASFDDKDLLTDFDYITGGEYVEIKSPNDSRTYRMLFFDNYGYGWLLIYSLNGNNFSLKCVSECDTTGFDEVWKDMLERIDTEYSEDNPLIQETITNKQNRSINVHYYHIDE